MVIASELKNKRCLVLGSAGFIGINLAKALLKSGASVRCFARTISQFLENDGRYEWMLGDFSNSQAIKMAIKDCDIIYHLIDDSIPDSANKDPKRAIESNVFNTLNLLDACREEGSKKIIFVSSGGTVYGHSSAEFISEETITNPISAYGINKLMIEKYLFLYHHLYGLDYLIVRLSNPFGPYQMAKKKQGIIGTLVYNYVNEIVTDIWGDGSIIRDYVYIDDVMDALIKLANYSDDQKIFNVGSGVGRSIKNVIDDLNILTNGEIRVNYIDNKRSVDVKSNILSIDRIKSEIKWEPKKQWSDALKATIEWQVGK